MNPFDTVLIKFPFTSLASDKKRPGLVLAVTPYSSNLKLVTVAMITSKIDGVKLRGDVLLKGWEKSGLLHKSLARLSKVATIEEEMIEKKLGKLNSSDASEIKKAFRIIFQHLV